MTNVGFGTFFPKTCPTVFRVKNIAPNRKTIKIFNYPIVNGDTRDLMTIPECSEADIRHSLLKGELNIKIKHREIIVVESNIDLLQFDDCHKQFLMDAGITEGLEVQAVAVIPYLFKQGVSLVGAKNGTNRVFTVPSPDKFINGTFGANQFKILIKHNGRDLVDTEYTISESGGVGTGYDTITFTAFTPTSSSTLVADYVIEA